MKRIALIAGLLVATTANAEDIEGIQNHGIQTMFWTAPCTETIAMIDINPDPSLPMNDMISIMARQAMAWGHLLGFESANPGIRGDHETILMRLRTDCANQPEKTAMALLMGYAGK